ncbi:MAG TPA: hypothetical protein VIV60_30770 [Polyangiaceae bacterium]
MNERLLIDAIVRQTVILIAQLSTVNGVRSPLSHVADQVFLGLVRELESQGVGKKVIADMFGLALRSYQQKVQRLGESATERGVTLWSAIHGYLADVSSCSRAEVLDHFQHDEPQNVRSILNDLVETGLVMRSGRGAEARYRVATAEELEELGASTNADAKETLAALVWLQVYHASPIRKDELQRLVPLPVQTLDAALERLSADKRIRVVTKPDGQYCLTDQCLIPLGHAAGWEAAVVDHHRAVLGALAAKVGQGQHVSHAADEVGGTTLSFDLWPGHPREAEVRRLLATVRQQAISLWDDTETYNQQHRTDASDDAAYRVTFYCGQHIVQEDDGT